MHEIITLQLGHRANYVGTHFWNAQEAYFTYGDETPSPIDHNVHFRPGIGAGGVDTFTPRALIYDLKGGFGTMRKINSLYDESEDGGPNGSQKVLWDVPAQTQKEQPLELIQYQKDLEAGVHPPTPLKTSDIRYWSDYNRVYFHPRSSVQLTDYELGSKLQPFENYDLGIELFRQLNQEHDLLDRDFRMFAEECDQLQGVQIVTDADNGWAGFATEYIEELRDEYGKTALFTWGLERTERVSRELQIMRQISLAKTLSKAVSLSSIYIPLAYAPLKVPDTISMERTSHWHAAALLAAAFETSTLQTRLKLENGGCTMNNTTALITAGTRRNVALLSLDIAKQEIGKNPTAQVAEQRNMVNCSWDETTQLNRKSHTFSEIWTVRSPADDQSASDDAGSLGRQDPIISRFHTQLEFPIVDSFPNIFQRSELVDAPNKGSCAAETLLSMSTSVIPHITDLKNFVGRAIKVQEREFLLNGLDDIIDDFQDGWNSDSDWDDDI